MRRGLAALLVLGALFAVAWWAARRAHLPVRRPSPVMTTKAATRAQPPSPPWRLPSAKTTRAAAPEASAGFGGRVLSTATARPIAHAALTFLHEGAALLAESDDAGRFMVAGAAPGTYELTSATARGFAPFEAELGHSPVQVTTRPGVRVDGVTIFLVPATALTVVVQDSAGRPIAGAEVRAVDERGRVVAGPVATDDKGEASLGVASFELIEARKAGYHRGTRYVGGGARAAGRIVVALEPGQDPAPLAIAGRVVDAHGAPVDGALVEAWPTRRDDGETRGQALSGADGRFTVAMLAPGSYHVRAVARGQGSAELGGIDAGRRDVELHLGAPDAGIHGTVRDGDGKPVTAFTVVAWPRQGVLGRGLAERATVVDPDGRYALPLPPGSYVVAAAARGLARLEDRAVEVADAPVEVDFTLGKGSRLQGRVVERAGGAPIAGAEVTLEASTLADGVTTLDDVQSDGDGSFAFDGLRPGRTSLNVQAAGHDGRILGGLDVPPDGALGPLTIDLAKVAPGEEPKTEFVGIGAVLGPTPDGLTVKAVNPGGGAADAHLVPGDIILSIDGQPVTDFENAIQLIRGPEGTVVTLTIEHADGSTSAVPVTRKRINF